ncbi:type III secretion system export apparatus subunit SctT, partial [Acinetobacter pittii]|uniref:type III secretion system export apparatus subunit SctT n=1 Tax=Acinetobacter pittii TaxID=48296 RepID=UPI00374F003C
MELVVAMVAGLVAVQAVAVMAERAAAMAAAAGETTVELAAVMAAGMVPPIGMGLATLLARRKFAESERQAGKAASVLGLCFISEGAIPFAAKDPLRVIPASIAGGALTGALSMYFGCKLQAPHGGLFVMLVPNAINHALAYLLAIVAGSLPPALDALDIALLIGKEVLLGLLIGFVATIPFWAMEATGFIIDNQRGAALASTFNPSLGSQTSPTGLLLTQTLITLFFSGGAFLALVGSLFRSYASWPVSSFFPQFGSQWVEFFYAQFSQMLMLCALFAAPLLIAMFLAEFGPALV